MCAIALLVLASTTSGAAADQGRPRDATLRVTVADQTGAVIVGATVTVQPADGSGTPREAITNDRGEAAVAGLVPGRYRVQAQFGGFEPRRLDDVRLRAGDTRREMRLDIAKLAEEVEVGQDGRDRALDRRGAAFSNSLSREQIESLPDDPEEMEEVLKEMAGPGAVLRVDGFRGGKLPPKSQIRGIRFRRDMFAAENHGGGLVFIDIITQPGMGPLRGSMDFTFRDETLNARNPLSPRRGAEQQQNGGFSLSGTLWKDRTSFSLTTNASNAYDSKPVRAALPETTFFENIRRPNDRVNFSARVDHALTKSHTLRGSYQRSASENGNLGIGDVDLPERGFTRMTNEDLLRLSLTGPIARTFYAESRLQVRQQATDSTSVSDAPAVLVLDAFNSGGAQIAGGRNSIDVEFAADVDYAKGRHSARAGLLFEAGRYRSDESRNYGGTFTFASLEAFAAGRPTTFTQRTGNPLVEFTHAQAGWYVQDDIRVSKALAVSLGVRQELQTHVPDWRNLAPRVGATWSPFKNGKTTFRASAGVFYDWYEPQAYEQTLRVDGTRQAETVVRNPGYPDAFTGGSVIVLPSGRILQSEDLRQPTTARVNGSVERVLGTFGRVNVGYFYSRGRQQLRGRNVNAPLENGQRPDPFAGNITQVESTARSEGRMLHAGLNVNVPWHRTMLFFNYTFGRVMNDSDGPFSLPADNADLAAEWGPGPYDVRHRLSGMFNMDLWKGFKIATNFSAATGTPYNITTGFDDNGDTISNDRPEGVGRNRARADGRWDVGGRLSWSFGFGQRKGDGSGGTQVVMVRHVGGAETMGGFSGGADNNRWRFEVYLAAQNVSNHTNWFGYSGVMTSPFFGRPTSASTPRRLELGTRFSF
jgi:hypothetical protein